MTHHVVLTHPTAASVQSPARRTLPRLSAFALDHLLLLPLGVLAALVWANLNAESYFTFAYRIDFWVNDVAMVFFFGLLTKEIVEATAPGGVLHSWRKAAVPAIAAVGAAILPALLYIWFVRLTDQRMLERAWPVAITTDVALTYFVARMIFRRHPIVPFLVLLGIIANALALMVIPAVRYPEVQLHPLGGGALMALALVILTALRRRRVMTFWPYVLVGGAVSWLALYWAGVHPGLALVPVIAFLPHAARDTGLFVDAPTGARDALSRFEQTWRIPVHITLFLFGLVNGGVLLQSLEVGTWALPVAAIIGRPIGILLAVGFAMAVGFHAPRHVGWRELVVASLVCASGFTMALFVGSAVLAPGQMLAMTRMGALITVTAAPLAVLLAILLRVGRFAR